MALYLAIICFGMAALCYLVGFVTEYRQSRRVGPYAIVPTLPYAVAAALFATMGQVSLRLLIAIPWWTFPLVFVCAVVIFGYGITFANARRDCRKEKRLADPDTSSDRDAV